MPQEYECIVEFSFIPKQEKFVVRFLDGKAYTLQVSSLPKKMQTKKPLWEEASLSIERSAIVIKVGDEVREIPSHVIHSRGQEL